jgi:hypothetical protein
MVDGGVEKAILSASVAIIDNSKHHKPLGKLFLNMAIFVLCCWYLHILVPHFGETFSLF